MSCFDSISTETNVQEMFSIGTVKVNLISENPDFVYCMDAKEERLTHSSGEVKII